MGSRTVFIIEDHQAFAEAIALAISLEPDLECLGVAATAEDGLERASATAPDVVLVDLGLPDQSGVDLVIDLRQRCPEASVVVLTGRSDGRVLREVAAADATAFISKSAPLHTILDAVRSASNTGSGLTISSESLAILHDLSPSASAIRTGLTSRELDILQRLNDGKRVAGIAQDLHMSVHTCRDHVKAILAKLEVHSQVEALARARQLGLLDN